MRKMRVMYEKTGRAVYISHLDIMRTFQRAITRAGIDIKHTEGFNPHPYISIALPLSLGYTGKCEFLDMVINDDMKCDEIVRRMNKTLPEGIHAVSAYCDASPVRNIAYSEYLLTLDYDGGIKDKTLQALDLLLKKEEIVVMKKSKRGEIETNIAPMIKTAKIEENGNSIKIKAVLASGNTSLNPEYIIRAIEKYIPESVPDFYTFTRNNVYDENMREFR